MWYQKILQENPLHFKDPTTVLFLFLVIAILSTVYFLRKRNGQKLPPGPIGLPILGYYPFLGEYPEKKLNELAKTYGNVFSLYIGPKYVVFLNDWTAAKEALGQDSTLDKPASTFSAVPYNFGIAGVNGPEWRETRRLSSRIIKDTGLNRAGWEDLIKEEVLDLVNQIAAEGDKPLEVRSMFQESFANNIMTLILGERLRKGHTLTKMISEKVDIILQNILPTSMANFSPALCRLLQLLGFEKNVLEFEWIEELGIFVSDTVDDKLRNSGGGFEDSFIGRYQKEIQNNKKSSKSSYVTVNSLKGDTLAMLTGGGETPRTTFIWTLIAMADRPKIQQKVHEELDAVIGREGSIGWEDRQKVPYTFATLLESMRWITSFPLTSAREISEDMQIHGYHIPKGTYIMQNTWAMHQDPKYWKNSEEFIPERFLSEDGKKVNTSPKSYNVFSYGKRNCPGRLLALLIALLYFTAIMQKFKVLPKEGKKVKYDILYGLSYQATNVELRFLPR